MKHSLILFGLLVAMCVVVCIVLVQDEIEHGRGFTHPKYETMQQGGSGQQRHAKVRWLGLTFGVLEIAFFVGCLVLGMRHANQRKWVFLLCGILHASVFAWMVIVDHYYARGEATTLVLGFPPPTALMLYGVGGVPLVFVLLYMFTFDRWILTAADFERFEQMVQEKRNRQQRSN